MTRPTSILVLADDLSGAAELAAIGSACGLRTAVVHGPPSAGRTAPLIVCDTDSRLDPPATAARIVRRAAGRRPPGTVIYKKTDSVLRGNVLAEVEALAERARCARVLLVPANPSLGRTIRDGRYFIDGVPIDRTAFARDPHHPARSSRVVDLLHPVRRLAVHVLKPGATLPKSGVVVGEVQSAADLVHWAGRVDADTLPAGGAEFFDAWLHTRGHASGRTPVYAGLPGPVLVISGTMAPTGRAALHGLDAPGRSVVSTVPDSSPRSAGAPFRRWVGEVGGHLDAHGLAVVFPPRTLQRRRDAPEAIRAAFAGLVKQLHRRRAFGHLVIEGGATAAAIMRALGWRELGVIGAWSQGVVTLQPARTPRCRLTIKPGSYPWPESLRRDLFARQPPAPRPARIRRS